MPHMDYTLSDGLYGSFNSVMYDHAVLSFRAVAVSKNNASVQETSARLFGPTCDGLDTVIEQTSLPMLSLGDLVLFPAMGAYTKTGACDFNGMRVSEPTVVYVHSMAD